MADVHPYLIAFGLGLTIISAIFYFGYLSPQYFSSVFANPCFGPNATIIITSMPRIFQGAYFTSFDKLGTGCTSLLQLSDVKVIGVTSQFDGDVHVDIAGRYFNNSAGSYQVYKMVTEFTPEILNLTVPKVNQTINIRGIAYCDIPHQGDAWHGRTCWELHPITQWSPNTTALPNGNYTFISEPIGAGT